MRVLVLGWEYPPAVAGGLGAACRGLTTALADRGHRVLLATPRLPGAPGPEAHPGVKAMPLASSTVEGPAGPAVATPYSSALLDPESTPGSTDGSGSGAAVDASTSGSKGSDPRAANARALYGSHLAQAVREYTLGAIRALANESFDVIHAHDWMTFPAALRLRLRTRRPVCLHVHSTAYDRSGTSELMRGPSVAAVERAGVLTADRVIAVSEYTRTILQREYGARPELLRVVHNGIDRLEAGAAEEPKRGVNTPPFVLFLGRLTRQKGLGFFLRAAARVHASRPDVRFVVAGDGEERVRAIELAATLGIADRVLFTGPVSDEVRDRAYRDASLFVLSSVSEPFGLTPLEALRHGTPSILTDACGVREVLPSAPVVPPWDAAGLAGEMLRLLENAADRSALVDAGRSEVQQLTWAKSAVALESVLTEATQIASRGNSR